MFWQKFMKEKLFVSSETGGWIVEQTENTELSIRSVISISQTLSFVFYFIWKFPFYAPVCINKPTIKGCIILIYNRLNK